MNLGRVKQLARLVAVIVIYAAVGALPAFAAENSGTRAFDPTLSLTGNCKTAPIDPVPDPGCPEGEHPSAGPFSSPESIAVDPHGDIYVACYGQETANGTEGRIDVFDPNGNFLTEIPDPAGPRSIAVDSEGNLYVFQFRSGVGAKVQRYSPSSGYDPTSGEISYGNAPVTIIASMPNFVSGLAVDPSNDHLFVNRGPSIEEFSSAVDGNETLGSFGSSVLGTPQGLGLAVDFSRNRIYVSDVQGSGTDLEYLVRVFELAPPHALLETLDGSSLPAGKFDIEPSLAADEETGNLFVYPEAEGVNKVAELDEGGTYVATIEHSFQYVYGAEIGIDNGSSSPHRGYLFVPSHPTGLGHSFAFGVEPEVCPPEVTATPFANVTEDEAQLWAAVNPCNLETHYVFEYTTQQRFEAEGFTGAQVAGEGEIAPGPAPVDVSASLSGLMPGTEYRFQVVATNEKGTAAGEDRFATYALVGSSELCSNATLRVGNSSLLPDCRAYELVTPPSTNARSPRGIRGIGAFFPTREASPDGSKLSFQIEGGTLPRSEGTGSLLGDPYLSTRGPAGWTTASAGPTGGETEALLPGSTSSDQGYSFWNTSGDEGSAVIEGETAYLRYPDGHSALVGRGSIADDPRAEGKLISEGGSHIVFVTTKEHGNIPVQLTEDAPPDGTAAIYDRTANEVTHVVSLRPGDITPEEGENAFFEGASIDGKGVAFRLGGSIASSPLYVRYDNTETFEFPEDVTFAGFAGGAKRVFYLEGGDLYAFDVPTGETIPFSVGGDVTVVNVAPAGGAAYFVSPKVLTSEANPLGTQAQAGKENLYLSQEGVIGFIGTVTEEDMLGEVTGAGLGNWIPHVVNYGEAGEEPSRTTPNGQTLLFESRAALTDYNSQEHVEIYRYDASANELTCLSCNPTQAPATSDASLQSMSGFLGDPQPFNFFAWVANLSPDGQRAFFQSTEPLVLRDSDELQDVYEWEAQGVGSCTQPDGCIYLISSGQSKRIDYLYAVSDSGDDVFFRSADLLVPADLEVTPSIYDARVGGGFLEAPRSQCEGEGCRPGIAAPPSMISPESGVHPETLEKKCPKGKRAVRRQGKTRCVKRHRHKHKRHRASAKRKGGRK